MEDEAQPQDTSERKPREYAFLAVHSKDGSLGAMVTTRKPSLRGAAVKVALKIARNDHDKGPAPARTIELFEGESRQLITIECWREDLRKNGLTPDIKIPVTSHEQWLELMFHWRFRVVSTTRPGTSAMGTLMRRWKRERRSLSLGESKELSVGPEEQAAIEGYIQAKTERFQKDGLDAYRQEDALGMPSEEWEPGMQEAVTRGMEQLSLGKGRDGQEPLEGLSVAGFHALMATLHLKVVAVRSNEKQGRYLDKALVQHRVNGWRGIVYHRV